MTADLQQEGVQFCSDIFENVRAMSADSVGVTRQGYGPVESKVIDYLVGIGRELQLEITTDPAGNVWMCLPGRDRTLPAFVSGSHADSVPQGGNYDGMAGVVAALAVAWWMRRTGYVPTRDYVVLIMRCEESSFFGKAYVGSLSWTGQLTQADTALKHRTQDVTLGDCMAACGFDPARITAGEPLVDLARIAAFVELHIEQGPTLDSSETERVGVVTGIRGNVRHKVVKCIGQTAHSGAVDKQYRHDAVMATAELINRMDKHWDAWLEKGEDLVFTVGVLKTAASSAISVIPGETTFTLDMRSLKIDTVERFHDLLVQEAEAIAKERGVTFEFDRKLVTQPAVVDEALSDRLADIARQCGIPAKRLASGAGHDAAVIGNKGVPVAMIFIANQNGSHNPYEAMEIKDFMIGTQLLWNVVEHFDD
ncbi:MAG: hydantoinase/carbamoylase family amidase [Duodenibacillus sp.]|nr:hydantoinase/carbamoylase family amidase [Duodenibacillus sp.]